MNLAWVGRASTCTTGRARSRLRSERHKPGLRVATPDNPAAIDIVVARTPATVTELGGVAAVRSRISYGVNQLNRALATSDVPAGVHVVNSHEPQATGVPGENAGTLLNMLSNPRNLSLGLMDNAQRAAFGADLVAPVADIPPEDSFGQADHPRKPGDSRKAPYPPQVHRAGCGASP
ncbi:hypothetical protein ABZ153_14085 [Streptomyces sp. NPDC006290]|uniref:hypothetical protein n=1 Tax=Streptomyces sp. NPDC006290 TaxID=3156745 RepID=UPI0033BA7C38